MQMQGSRRAGWGTGELCPAQSQEGRAVVPELCFLNSENLCDFFNPSEPPWSPRPGMETEPDCPM